MNAANEPLNQEILATILMDMEASGITDIVNDTSFDFFSESIVIKPVSVNKKQEIPVTSNANKVVEKTVIKADKPSNIPVATNLEKDVWVLNETAKIMCVAVGNKQGSEPFNNDEKILFLNMLKAINLNNSDIGYIVIDNNCCTDENMEQLTKICRRLLSASSAQVILSFGENICNILMGGNVSMSSTRGFGKEIASIKYVATYSPRSLLKQPLLKRLAWEDLQIAHGYMKVLSDV